MTMKKLLIPFFILTNTLFSQDTIKTKFTFDLTGSISQANTNKQDNILLNSFSSVGWKKFETGLSTSYQMMTNNNTQLINDFVLRVQPRVIDENYSIFSFGQISSLYSKKVNQRVEAGIGYGKTIFKRKLLESTFSLGTLYFNNDYSDLTNRKGLRVSPRIQLFGKNEKYKISYSFEGFYQPNLLDKKDYITNTKTTFLFDLNKKFSIKVNYSTSFESFIITGAQNDIKNFTMGFNLSI